MLQSTSTPVPPRSPAPTPAAYRPAPRRSWNLLARYTHWLHTKWPAGKVERLPKVGPDGRTNIPGVYMVGDLTGVPLLKFAADSGTRVVRTILRERPPQPATDAKAPAGSSEALLDLVIIGGGAAGYAAALEAHKHHLRFELIEAAEPFSTIVNFLKGKPIYTYPSNMTPEGDLQFHAQVKEELLEEVRAQTSHIPVRRARAERIARRGGVLHVHLTEDQTGNNPQPVLRARNVIIAIGRSGNYRTLDVPGEELPKVYNRLHDPKDFCRKRCLVVGGGDTAIETAIALAECGAEVTLSYRQPQFTRPKPENLERLNRLVRDPDAHVEIEEPHEMETTAVGEYLREHLDCPPPHRGRIRLLMPSRVTRILPEHVELEFGKRQPRKIRNDVVFTMLGREAPLDFFRRSKLKVAGDRGAVWWITLIAFLAFCLWMYHWKKGGVVITGIASVDQVLDVGNWWQEKGWFPYNVPPLLDSMGEAWRRPSHLLGVINRALNQPGFYYSLVYCICVVGFGIDRIRRKSTPYIKWQTFTLAAIQIVPLFLLPYLILPWMGYNGWFADGSVLAPVADQLFERYDAVGMERAYWRSFGFILAWPLFIWNVFTDKPMWAWLGISFVQTFVLIPGIIYFWGKGAYCGWICSCGALAETMGDRHRQKMPHGPLWNRLNMIGQVFLAFAVVLLILRSLGWAGVAWAANAYAWGLSKIPLVNYVWFIDLFWAGILGVGLYFWFSGRVWCRFACPLAALMNIYTRFSRFRILADKKKCISCNICTSVCHQGIDIMNFANKGLPMADPQCVRCSACIAHCPTGVLEFGQIDRKTGVTIRKDPGWLAASPVLIREAELTINGRKLKKSARRQ